MSSTHDIMAHATGKHLLSQLRNDDAPWAQESQLTNKTTYWRGIADWPRPDIILEDDTTQATFAVEFKPPGHNKREYITGLGQALSYLSDFGYAALVVPKVSQEGFPIATYLKECLNSDIGCALPIALFEYHKDPSGDISPVVDLRKREAPPTVKHGKHEKVFWAYWRDLSHFELFDILSDMDRMDTPSYDDAFAMHWTRVTSGKAMTWEGNPRCRKHTESSKTSERSNVGLSLHHIGVLDSGNRLTDLAYELIRVGRVYGPDSIAFLKCMGRAVLRQGRHLELILWVYEQQRNVDADSAKEFYSQMDQCLLTEGVISHTPQRGGKPTFVRDEPKLWNKLELLIPSSGKSYYHPKQGLVFDWERVISILDD